MTFLSRPTLFLPVLGGAVLLASAAMLTLPAPDVIRALVPAIIAMGVGFLAWRGGEIGRGQAELRAADAEAALATARKASSELRHDLRGALSPVLLNADRLSTHPDATVRRAADTMIGTIERIEARLREG
ncbi:hypothetical protein NFI95_02750 [Acetobacteraceae bacterium KSS8]|uniref:Signal transduction histidine kinase dimerisation/phosphoacceptor domain-containing protein n=1 Tax=Endosaccharibacter trunci TaxID=2812733 RepID=A0ABT1W3C6_9PROT|nr:hypothetical protein [Acetobacteraceae bacterium KSS8]